MLQQPAPSLQSHTHTSYGFSCPQVGTRYTLVEPTPGPYCGVDMATDIDIS